MTQSNHFFLSFWKKLGTFMSKVSKEQSMVHFMESNVGGNKQGEEVRERYTQTQFNVIACSCCSILKPPCIVTKSKFKHRLSLDHLVSQCNSNTHLSLCLCTGRKMLETYYDVNKFKTWKSTRYTKLRLYK